ncbi:C1 family peptidase [Aestuariicella hydrocarbonica]|uniref:C1 family peptidase n=1 Tax=Pseudomaricurvus hydrocarbonicus TaxID=1470433 RepID=A0A9E5MQB9_9GAMM|nr:C1 family peptidase [Aestuariicella hydrocarbonica]NHO68352.1 C1 family peptidase [Aestuariicella hydrocarbonica]
MNSYPTREELNVEADAPDFRDIYYSPSLLPLKKRVHPPGNLYILNQGTEGACTGFGLAATINLLYRFQEKEARVSARMLYEMAKRYDEWPGEDYEGSSCRGAIKGWKNTGVCREQLAPYQPKQTSFHITPDISEDAKSNTIGAYYRLRPQITDYHCAINEVGVVFVSAKVHKGWYHTEANDEGEHYIPPHQENIGGHAFAIIGYNDSGFWVQNSWGEEHWGKSGIALWHYADWAKNIMDGWVVQLALPTPQIFTSAGSVGSGSAANHQAKLSSTPRQLIEPHFVHLDDGHYDDSGRYWSNAHHMTLVQHHLQHDDYQHLLLYAHGGLNSIKDSATRIAAMKDTFLDNGIYPFHFMYDTGLAEELKDIILGKQQVAETIAGSFSDWVDRRIENLTQKVGRALWREMKNGARKPFERTSSDGSHTVKRIVTTLSSLERNVKLHLIGHSTGAILQAHLLAMVGKHLSGVHIETCSLLAPAATVELFESHYRPLLESGLIKQLCIYNLSEQLELDDHVARVYRKSLLYLVSRAFEEHHGTPLLGMQKYSKEIEKDQLAIELVYSRGKKGRRTASHSHGGFDNDPDTMNDVLRRILGEKPKSPFTRESLNY